MKTIKSLIAISLLTSLSTFAAEYHEVTRLGNPSTAICRPAINSAAELQSFALNQSQDVIDILNSAGWSGNTDDFFNAVEQGQFVEKSYAVGSKFEWMGQRENGEVIAKPKKIWAGKQPFSGFELNIKSNCMAHTIVIPKACCNVSLVASSTIAIPEPTLKSVIDGNSVTVNVDSGGDGSITELTMPDGSTQIIDTASGSWTGELAPGTYQVVSRTANDCGESGLVTDSFTIAEPVAVLAPPAAIVPSGFFFAPFLGRQVRAIDPPLMGIKVGHLNPISENVDFLIQGGVSYNIKHAELSLFVDLGLERKFGNKGGFVGAGVGLWDFHKDSFLINGANKYTREDTTYFIHGGANTKWSYRERPVKWFAEARVFSDFTDDISRHNVVKLGLRYNN